MSCVGATILALAVIKQQEEIRRWRALHRQRIMKSLHDLLALPEKEFISLFRLNKKLFLDLCESVRSALEPQCNRTDICSVEMKVLCALRFYATGSYQESTAKNLCMCYRNAHSNIAAVSQAILDLLFCKWVSFPSNPRVQQKIKQQFLEHSGLPGVLGAIDCTRISIIPPEICCREDYYNQERIHSLIVQMVCDTNLKIINICARYPGTSEDAYVYRTSNLRQAFKANLLTPHEFAYLIGDIDFPLEPWLLTPVLSPPDNSPEARFNECHKLARNPIERLTKMLKSRFRCLQNRKLHCEPIIAITIVNACAVLHNMCIKENIDLDEIIPGEPNFDITDRYIHPNSEENATAMAIRHKLICSRFTN